MVKPWFGEYKIAYLVSFERFFYDFDNPVNLLHADHGESADVLGVGFSLGDTSGHHNLLAVVQTSVDLVTKVVLGGALDGARVQNPNVGLAFRLGDLVTLKKWNRNNISYICFLAVVRNVHCLFYMGLVGHSKTNLETRIPDFCLMGSKYF